MLSILIPIYNINCITLVEKLLIQCSERLDHYEIICIDDHSQDRYKEANLLLSTLDNVRYIELGENIGRARIRNLLAEKAVFENLLFIDADSTIINDDFISKYFDISKSEKMVYGGTKYPLQCPTDISKILHWKYASKYEALSCDKRNKKPYLAFMSNNFLIKKDLFMSVLFDTDHKGYGYEDTLFAEEIRKRVVKIQHIDNPVEHTGLASAEFFLYKTDEAMKNLALLYTEGKLSDTSLIKFYEKLKKIKLDGIAALVIKQFLPLLIRNLKSGNPLLYLFQLYKYLKFFENLRSLGIQRN